MGFLSQCHCPASLRALSSAQCSQPASPWQLSQVPGSTGQWDAGKTAGDSCDPEPLLQS